MELYLIRHGQSYNNALDAGSTRVQDPPLTEIGQKQAKLVGEYLRDSPARSLYGRETYEEGHGITRVVASPMERALHTASHISKALGLDIEVWTDVHEEMGIWLEGSGPLPGMTRSEILARFPNARLPDDVTEAGWWNRPAETRPEWEKRAAGVVKRFREEFAGTDERVAVVTHGGFTGGFLAALLNGGAWSGLRFSTQNTSIARIDFEDDGVAVRYVNRIEHLPPELVT